MKPRLAHAEARRFSECGGAGCQAARPAAGPIGGHDHQGEDISAGTSNAPTRITRTGRPGAAPGRPPIRHRWQRRRFPLFQQVHLFWPAIDGKPASPAPCFSISNGTARPLTPPCQSIVRTTLCCATQACGSATITQQRRRSYPPSLSREHTSLWLPCLLPLFVLIHIH